MVSMCEDCRTEKNKVKIFNKILLNKNCINISKFLHCNEYMKAADITNDPIYKTLNVEQQEIYKIIKVFPFPNKIDDFIKYSDNFHSKHFNEYIKKVDQTNYNKTKDMYEHMCLQDYYFNNSCCENFDIKYYNSFKVVFIIFSEHIQFILRKHLYLMSLTMKTLRK